MTKSLAFTTEKTLGELSDNQCLQELPFTKETLSHKIMSVTTRDTEDKQVYQKGKKIKELIEGDLNVNFSINTYSKLLESVLNSNETFETSNYIRNSNVIRSFTLEKQLVDYGIKFQRLHGMCPRSMYLEASISDIIKGEFSFIGMSTKYTNEPISTDNKYQPNEYKALTSNINVKNVIFGQNNLSDEKYGNYLQHLDIDVRNNNTLEFDSNYSNKIDPRTINSGTFEVGGNLIISVNNLNSIIKPYIEDRTFHFQFEIHSDRVSYLFRFPSIQIRSVKQKEHDIFNNYEIVWKAFCCEFEGCTMEIRKLYDGA